MIATICIKKLASLFSDEVSSKDIDSYMGFVQEYLKANSLRFKNADLDALKLKLLNCVSRNKSPKASLKKVRDHVINRPKKLEQLCLDIAGFDPDSERFGTASRKEFE